MLEVSILVNSCDKYKFLWPIFFKYAKKSGLFDLGLHVFLNNELYEDYFLSNNYKFTYISQLRGAQKFPIENWTDHVKTALNVIKSKYIIIIQDDYILSKSIDKNQLHNLVKDMEFDDYISSVSLNNFIHRNNSKYNNKFNKNRFGKYYLNTQIAIWRRTDLINCMRQKLNPWKWELYEYKNFGNMNILSYSNEKIYFDYKAIILKSKLLKDSIKYIDESEYKLIADLIGENLNIINKIITLLFSLK